VNRRHGVRLATTATTAPAAILGWIPIDTVVAHLCRLIELHRAWSVVRLARSLVLLVEYRGVVSAVRLRRNAVIP
jgi:Co/Zn/Cd efflux system component